MLLLSLSSLVISVVGWSLLVSVVPEYILTEHDAALCQIVRTYGNLADVTGKYPDAFDTYLSADGRRQHMPGL